MCENVTLFEPEPVFPEKDFFGRHVLPELPPEAYQSIFEPAEEWWSEPDCLTFSIDSLNLAAICLRKFITTRDTLDWYHVQVCAVSFSSFYRVMEKDDGVTVLLPFWCWCDGGYHNKALYRQHRHMIAVAPKGHFFKNVWRKLADAEKEKSSNHCKYFYNRYIKCPRHLMNTIAYVSQQKSRCRRSALVQTRMNHFCINITFPSSFKWVLACCWEKGLRQFIYEKCIWLSPNELFSNVKTFQDTLKISVQDLPIVPKNFVFPVSKEFFPTHQPTPYFLHLGNNRKIYFEKDERLLDDTEWVQVQARLGNCFYKFIENEWWNPTLYQKVHLNIILLLKKRIADLEKENKYLKSQPMINVNKKAKPEGDTLD